MAVVRRPARPGHRWMAVLVAVTAAMAVAGPGSIASAGGADVAGASQPPPVPLDPPPVPPAVPLDRVDDVDGAGPRAAAAEPPTRAFGRQPYQDTTAAAARVATAQRAAGCGLSNASLAGILLSITFTEAGPLASTT